MLDLKKGESLNLAKAAPGLVTPFIGCGWTAGFDLDLSAFAMSGGKASSSGVLYYGTPGKALPGLIHSGDNRTGVGDGDDEVIKVDFSKLGAGVDEVRFVVNIYNAGGKTFADVKDEYVRIVDGDKQIARFDVGDTAGSTVHFCTLKKNGAGEWEFVAVGQSLPYADLNGILSAWS